MELVEPILRQLAAAGTFGSGRLLAVREDAAEQVGAQFASQILRLVVETEAASGERQEWRLVAKLQLTDPVEREMRDSDKQFYNEVLMYREVLGFLDRADRHFYPRMYHGTATLGADPASDVVILENLSPRGYRIAAAKLFLDFQHVALALKRLGEFHSWSYQAKATNSQEFQDKIKKLEIPIFKSTPDFNAEELLPVGIKRGIQPFIDKNIEAEKLLKFLSALENIDFLFFLLCDPVEPFATLCHGDFCKNNVFYKYDADGKPIDCALFDFQQSKYTSPVIDLSFFLYMHTTQEMRESHWDELLQIYWKSVVESVKDVKLPSYDEFLDEFSSRAVYAYLHCSFFAPIMLLTEPFSMENLRKMPVEKQKDFYQNSAGEEGTKVISNIIKHFIDRNYISKFIEYYDRRRTTA